MNNTEITNLKVNDDIFSDICDASICEDDFSDTSDEELNENLCNDSDYKHEYYKYEIKKIASLSQKSN